ncbi:MAG: hypothetical protein PWQ55_332 [Chloroflexota bacterium]|nr:hypothetical protein [Chloroflexota bacterium]
MEYKSIIDAVFCSDAALPSTLVYELGQTSVYQVNTPTPLIVRVIADDTSSYEYKQALQDETAAQDDLTARILHWETREIDGQACGIQVQTFIPGQPIDHYPDREESRVIVGAVYKLQKRLCAASVEIGTNNAPGFHNVIEQIIPLVDECSLKTAAIELMENERYLELIAQPEPCLIYGDLWYKNLLLEKKWGRTEVGIIDLDPLLLGPKILQPAVLFSSYFLFYAILFESDPFSVFNLDDLLSLWPEPLDKEDVLLMMRVFPIGLGLRKAYQFAQGTDANPEGGQSVLRPFEQSLQLIDQLLETT